MYYHSGQALIWLVLVSIEHGGKTAGHIEPAPTARLGRVALYWNRVLEIVACRDRRRCRVNWLERAGVGLKSIQLLDKHLIVQRGDRVLALLAPRNLLFNVDEFRVVDSHFKKLTHPLIPSIKQTYLKANNNRF